MLVTIAMAAQTALFCQPDAKVANGMYWTEFWLTLCAGILT